MGAGGLVLQRLSYGKARIRDLKKVKTSQLEKSKSKKSQIEKSKKVKFKSQKKSKKTKKSTIDHSSKKSKKGTKKSKKYKNSQNGGSSPWRITGVKKIKKTIKKSRKQVNRRPQLEKVKKVKKSQKSRKNVEKGRIWANWLFLTFWNLLIWLFLTLTFGIDFFDVFFDSLNLENRLFPMKVFYKIGPYIATVFQSRSVNCDTAFRFLAFLLHSAAPKPSSIMFTSLV